MKTMAQAVLLLLVCAVAQLLAVTALNNGKRAHTSTTSSTLVLTKNNPFGRCGPYASNGLAVMGADALRD